MFEELQFQVMRLLSERLSATQADLVRALGRPDTEVKQALLDLEKQQLIHSAYDSITGSSLISPTSMGLLRFRQNASMTG